MELLKEIERIEALAENKRDSVKLANFWKMYALELRDEKNAEIESLRQQLASQPSVDVLVDALREVSYQADLCAEYHIRDLADKALDTYSKPITEDKDNG